MEHTVLFAFGDTAENAAGAVCCENLEVALREVAKVFANEHKAPVYEVAIRPGDHAPRLDGSAWVWPERHGWPLGKFRNNPWVCFGAPGEWRT